MNAKFVKALFLVSITAAAPVFCNEQRALEKTSVSAQQIKPSFVEGIKKALTDKVKALQKYVVENKKKSAFAALVCAYCIAFYNRERLFLYAAEHESRVGYNLVKYALYLPRGVRTDGTSKFSDRIHEVKIFVKDKKGNIIFEKQFSRPLFGTPWQSGGNKMNFTDRALFAAASQNNTRALDFIESQEQPSDEAKANILRQTAFDGSLNDANKNLSGAWIKKQQQLNSSNKEHKAVDHFDWYPNYGGHQGIHILQSAAIGQNRDYIEHMKQYGIARGSVENGFSIPEGSEFAKPK